MIILSILTIALFISLYIAYKNGGLLTIIISMLIGMYLVIHVVLWSIAGYDYGKFVSKRAAFVETLENARRGDHPMEVAAITKEVSEWNEELAERKYNLSIFLLHNYVDKRTNNLEPIK